MVKGAVLHGPELHAIAKALQLDPNAAEEGDIVDSFENYLGRRGEVVIAATKALAGEDPDTGNLDPAVVKSVHQALDSIGAFNAE